MGLCDEACGQCILAPIHWKPGAPPVIATTDVFIPRLVSPRDLVQHWTVPYQDTYGALAGPPSTDRLSPLKPLSSRSPSLPGCQSPWE